MSNDRTLARSILEPLWSCWNQISYSRLLAKAASDERVFANFRRTRRYRADIENVSESDGETLFQSLKNHDVLHLLAETHHADTIGNPRVHSFSGTLHSPTTIRYAAILEQIAKQFDDFRDVRRICEIGVGYGGQARIISQYMARMGRVLESYTLVDLPDALRISRQYLEHFSFPNRFIYKTRSELPGKPDEPYDLAISNFAFSEFPHVYQKEYVAKLFLNSRGGFFLMNNGLTVNGERVIAPLGNNESYRDVDLLQTLPNARKIKESALMPGGIYLITFNGSRRTVPSFVE